MKSDPLPILLVVTACAYQFECIWCQKLMDSGATFGMTRSSSHLAPRRRYSLQDLLLATALVALYLGAYAAIYRSLEQDDVETYRVGTNIGLAAGLMSIVSLRLRARLRNMSRFRIRLVAQIDWPGLFTGLVCQLLVGCLFLYLLPLPSPAFAGLAVGLTMSAIMALATVAFPYIDLTHRGIIAGVFSTLILWRNIRLRAWDKDVTERLDVGIGFLRTVAYVPEELRDEVDALLSEKFKPAGAVS